LGKERQGRREEKEKAPSLRKREEREGQEDHGERATVGEVTTGKHLAAQCAREQARPRRRQRDDQEVERQKGKRRRHATYNGRTRKPDWLGCEGKA